MPIKLLPVFLFPVLSIPFQADDRCRKVTVEKTELESKLESAGDDYEDLLKKYRALVQQVNLVTLTLIVFL